MDKWPTWGRQLRQGQGWSGLLPGRGSHWPDSEFLVSINVSLLRVLTTWHRQL